MMRELKFVVTSAEDGVTAGVFLKSKGFSMRLIRRLKAEGGITRDGETLRTRDILREGDTAAVVMGAERSLVKNPDVNARVVYQDEDVIVFDKAPFVPVHPSQGHYSDTLGNLFSYLVPDTTFRPINRLDRNTSGLCVCAKNEWAAALLAGSTDKTYYAAADGEECDSGIIDAPIGREDGGIIKREVRPDGERAVTLYRPLFCGGGRTLYEVKLLTGRTHQIRVHFAHIKRPLCGDDLYGGDCSGINRHALHCGRVGFTTPFGNEKKELAAPFPEDIARLFPKELWEEFAPRVVRGMTQ